MEDKRNILELQVIYEINEDKDECRAIFIPSINNEMRRPEFAHVSFQFFNTLREEIAAIYEFCREKLSVTESEIEVRKISVEKISEPAKDILASIDGDTTIEKVEAIGRKIYRKLLPKQLRDYIEDKKYDISAIDIISKDFLIPFELIHDGLMFLATKFEFYRKPLFDEGEKENPTIVSRAKDLPTIVRFFTNPTGDLKDSEDETSKIINFFKTKNDLDLDIKDYTYKGTFYNRLVNTFNKLRLDIFHYSGHLSIIEKDSGEDICFHLYDKPLSVRDISLFYPALFFLNMCEADITVHQKTAYKGEETLNFPLSIMKQGAKACIATIWPILDESAAKFAINFYDHSILKGESFGKAICLAKKKLKEISDLNDMTWLSFVLYGDPNNAHFENISKKEYFNNDLIMEKVSEIDKNQVLISEPVSGDIKIFDSIKDKVDNLMKDFSVKLDEIIALKSDEFITRLDGIERRHTITEDKPIKTSRRKLRVFISHALVDYKTYRIGEIAKYLESKKEISYIYYVEEDLVGNIDDWMLKTIPRCHLLIFIATDNSLNSKDCLAEIRLALKYDINITPILGENMKWEDLEMKWEDLELDLSRQFGKEFDSEDFGRFCKDLYDYILKYKLYLEREIKKYSKKKS